MINLQNLIPKIAEIISALTNNVSTMFKVLILTQLTFQQRFKILSLIPSLKY